MLSAKLKSKWWRLNHLYKIKNKQGKVIFYKPNSMQIKHRLDADGYRYGYLVKPRQFGFTTDYAIDMLDDACFVSGASSGIIAHDRETLGKIFQIIKRGYDNMPLEFKPIAKYDTRNEYKFVSRFDGLPLDNELYVALKIRGTTIPRIHVSEAAFIDYRDELKMGAKQAVPKTGRITEETTGNGMNEFYDDVMAALEKKKSGKMTAQDYNVYFYAWFENPEYSLDGTLPEPDIIKYGDEQKEREKYNLTDGQLLWRRWKLDEIRTSNQNTAGLNVFQRFWQEYPSTLLEAFQSGMGGIFDLTQLSDMSPGISLTIQDILNYSHPTSGPLAQDIKTKIINLIGKEIYIWHIPQPDTRYVIGVDPSDGEGSDNTCIDVWEIPKLPTDKLIQVAQYYGKIRPDHGAQLAKEIAECYNDAFVAPENNMLSFVLFLSKIYDNYFMEVKIDKKTLKRTTTLGWSTNQATRDPMIDDFIALFEDGHLEINSSVTISEMKTFVKKENGKREHADGKHDDSLIAGMIALQMRKYQPRRTRTFATKPF